WMVSSLSHCLALAVASLVAVPASASAPEAAASSSTMAVAMAVVVVATMVVVAVHSLAAVVGLTAPATRHSAVVHQAQANSLDLQECRQHLSGAPAALLRNTPERRRHRTPTALSSLDRGPRRRSVFRRQLHQRRNPLAAHWSFVFVVRDARPSASGSSPTSTSRKR
ncbi:unnamed protein product, partial [Urochloa humidicola]